MEAMLGCLFIIILILALGSSFASRIRIEDWILCCLLLRLSSIALKVYLTPFPLSSVLVSLAQSCERQFGAVVYLLVYLNSSTGAQRAVAAWSPAGHSG